MYRWVQTAILPLFTLDSTHETQMVSDTQIVTDPVGYTIHLPVQLKAEMTGDASQHVTLNGVQQVVETPACIIELPCGMRCYFRSLGWNFTVVLCAVFRDEIWQANTFQKNPSTEYIQRLLSEGRFIACGSLD